MIHILRTVLFIAIVITVSACDRTNAFDTVCSYFDLLENEAASKSLNSDEKFTFINDLIKKNMPDDNPAKASWSAIVNFTPAEGRYPIYKDAAEVTLKRSWQCDSMEMLLKDI